MSSDTAGIVCVSLLGMLILIAGLGIGFPIGAEYVRREAIKHGAAEWQCDSTTGETKFVWREVRP